jgi:hypothetical protein
MAYDTPYHVERSVTVGHNGNAITNFAIHRSGDGELVHGDDPVLLHRICELLNEQANGTDIHR